jgi:hypothetical protein
MGLLSWIVFNPSKLKVPLYFNRRFVILKYFSLLKVGPFSFRLSLFHHVNPASLELRDSQSSERVESYRNQRGLTFHLYLRKMAVQNSAYMPSEAQVQRKATHRGSVRFIRCGKPSKNCCRVCRPRKMRFHQEARGRGFQLGVPANYG